MPPSLSWESEYSNKTGDRHQDLHVIAGSMLSVLSCLTHVFKEGSRAARGRANQLQVGDEGMEGSGGALRSRGGGAVI